MPGGAPQSTPRRITIVTRELLGYVSTGGVGTATTFLALGLARMHHRVDVLYIGEQPAEGVDPEWSAVYEDAAVRIHTAPHGRTRVEPSYFARVRDVETALRADPPDVVIAHEFSAPTYSALRLRRLGLDFENTLFVAYCHGTSRLAKEGRRVNVSAEAVAMNMLEQASVELADVAVSPSAYLVDWMRRQGWSLPATTLVVPLVTRASAVHEPVRDRGELHSNTQVERLAFFGRLEERKGIRQFAAGVSAVDPELLQKVELEFLGHPTKGWSTDDVEALFSDQARQSLRRISFATNLDQREALERLRRSGTLAVVPSLVENSPNVIYECLENNIPFVASDVGGIRELVAPEERDRILFEPTQGGVKAMLTRALSDENALRPVRPGFDPEASLRSWAQAIETRPDQPAKVDATVPVDVIVIDQGSTEALKQCRSALARQSYAHFDVIVAASDHSPEAARATGLRTAKAPWVVFLDESDVPTDQFLTTLVRAQVASGADIVTCGLTIDDGRQGPTDHLFVGEPGGTAVLENGYGTVSLLRRSLLRDEEIVPPGAADPDWPLLARLSASGAHVVSIPTSLVSRRIPPGTLERQPADALLVLEELERALPDAVGSVARLAAGLAADSQRALTASSETRQKQRFGRLRKLLSVKD